MRTLPLASVTSIDPGEEAPPEVGPAAITEACRLVPSSTVTRNNRVDRASASRHDTAVVLSSCPASYSLRQWNTWFALIHAPARQ
jgi:hypothetical protein